MINDDLCGARYLANKISRRNINQRKELQIAKLIASNAKKRTTID